MINNNNLCLFEGKMTKNANYSQFNGANGPVDKAFFSIMVPRALTSQQRQAVKGGDQSVKGNDFVKCSLIGAQVATLKQYFPEGTPIKVLARFTEYQKTDAATGAKTYDYCFEVENLSFVVSPSQNQQNNQGGAAANTGYQAPQQNYNNNNGGYQQQPQQPVQQQGQQQPQQNNPNFEMFPVSAENYPF